MWYLQGTIKFCLITSDRYALYFTYLILHILKGSRQKYLLLGKPKLKSPLYPSSVIYGIDPNVYVYTQ